MSSSPPTTELVVPDSNHRESIGDFVRWALAQLELEVQEDQGILKLEVPEADQPNFSGQTLLKLSLDGTVTDNSFEAVRVDRRFGQWLLTRLSSRGSAVSARPAIQPTTVKDITDKLFGAYQVDDGRVHLGGCQLTDYPFLRLSFVAHENGHEEIRHLFVAHDGSSVSDELARELGLLEIEPILQRPPRIDETALQSLITAGKRVAAQSSTSRNPNATPVEPVATALVWVKHASGKLNFTVGETTVSLSFSGWAKLLHAQPYSSPHTGASSFHLAATDDGRIDAIDQIATCEQSGRRVLRQELVTCSTTGKHVLEEFTEICPVSGKPCLAEQFATCLTCKQRVSRQVIRDNACSACHHLTKIKNDDPRLVWILGEHMGLERWKSWKLAETKLVYIAQASSWTKKLLVVVDKESLAVHHLATAGKLSSTWAPIAESARGELLS